MRRPQKKQLDKAKQKYARAAISLDLGEGKLAEAVVTDGGRRSAFCVWDGDKLSLESDLVHEGQRYRPYSPKNALIEHGIVLLPPEPTDYGDSKALLKRIQAFIHKYVDLSPTYERVAANYVLLTWIYDAFQELPYLRLRGEPGTGKTRFLLTVGSLCYKPIFASGASTVSPLFRILDSFRGTLVIDEGNWRLTDEKSEITKILCNGNGRGFPVLRSEPTGPNQEYAPRAYHVFGPKLIATRGPFKDLALESRCLSEDMGARPMRGDVPISLPSEFHEEAAVLRGQLLLWRFRNRGKHPRPAFAGLEGLEPRLRQVFAPLLSVAKDNTDRDLICGLATDLAGRLQQERESRPEAQVAQIIEEMREQGERLQIKEIARWFEDRHGDEYSRKITARWVGWLIRERLRLKVERVGGTHIIRTSSRPPA